jgi:hypothetical protein
VRAVATDLNDARFFDEEMLAPVLKVAAKRLSE